MNYEWDVFLSYSRHQQWTKWVRDTFKELFDFWVGNELGRDVRVFFDQQIEDGRSWPEELAYGHAHSCILVPLISGRYFTSPWCTTEFGLMRDREVAAGFGTIAKRQRLIVPATINDNDPPAPEVARITTLQIRQYTNPYMVENGATAEALSASIRDWAPAVVAAIKSQAPYEERWVQMAAQRFEHVYETRAVPTQQLPGLGAAPPKEPGAPSP